MTKGAEKMKRKLSEQTRSFVVTYVSCVAVVVTIVGSGIWIVPINLAAGLITCSVMSYVAGSVVTYVLSKEGR